MRMQKQKKQILKRLILGALSGYLLGWGGAGVVANEAVIVNIQAPNQDGISVNQYSGFTVGEQGMVLNNATEQTDTQLAGQIEANPNLTDAAELIVNEVMGKTRSALYGAVEVAGTRADIIIANPNGIDVNGARFINAGEVSLWAGRPNYVEGKLQRGQVHASGDIAIYKKGLQIEPGKLALVANRITVDGDVRAKDIYVVTGEGELSLGKQRQTFSDKPGTSRKVVDVSAYGGMYADTIYIETESLGTGIHSDGTLQGAEQVVLQANGDITLRGKTVSKDLQINAAKEVELAPDTQVSVHTQQKHQAIPEPIIESEEAESETVIEEQDSLPAQEIRIAKATNGAVVMDVLAPDSQGVSINRLADFTVDKSGLVLNNTLTETATITAGTIQRNRNYGKHVAQLIVAEVTGKDESTLQGNLEIAGARASFLLANPNGITLDGAQLTNMDYASLVTGALPHDISYAKELYIRPQGTLAVVGNGLYGNGVQYTNLVGNEMKIWSSVNGDIGGLNMTGWGQPATITVMQARPTGLPNPTPPESEVTPTPSPVPLPAHTVRIETAANGAQVMDILAPDQYGVSLNQLERFNVLRSGLVLNNSLGTVTTEVAGTIHKNSNFADRTAGLIVGEVTGDRRSLINGTLEVGGDKASVLIANPNGITLDGAKVLHSDRVTFHAGTIQWQDGQPQLSSRNQTIDIASLDTRHIGQTNIIGGILRVQGSVQGENLNFFTGAGTVNAAGGKISAAATANKEQTLSTVTSAGHIQAQGITWQSADADASLLLEGNLQAARTLRIRLQGDIEQNGVINGLGLTEISTDRNALNRGAIKGGRVLLTATDLINEGGILGGTLDLRAKRLENAAGEKKVNPKIAEWDEKIKAKEREIAELNKELDYFNRNNRDEAEDYEQERDNAEEELATLRTEQAAFAPYVYSGRVGGVIYGVGGVRIRSQYLYNRERAVIAGDGNVHLEGIDTKSEQEPSYAELIHNNGGDIRSAGDLYIAARKIKNTNADLQLRTVEGKWEKDPDRIEIEAEGTEYNHLIATKNKFRNLNGRHSYDYFPHPDKYGKYVAVNDVTISDYFSDEPDEKDFDIEEEWDAEYNDWRSAQNEMNGLLRELGIPLAHVKEQSETELKQQIADKIKEKFGKTLDEYNAMVREYNTLETFRTYWEIHSAQKNIHTELVSASPGSVIADRNIRLFGELTNQDSRIIAGEQIRIDGTWKNIAAAVEKKRLHKGEISHSSPEQHWHHFHNKTERRWTLYQPYQEPDETVAYYLPTVTYYTSAATGSGALALTPSQKNGGKEGSYRLEEETHWRNGKKENDVVITLHKENDIQEKTASSLISAKEIIAQSNTGSYNEGTVLAHAIALQGSDLNNRGRIEADDVTLKLEDAFTHTGDLIVAKKLAAEAGTIRMTAPDILAQEPSHHDYARRGVVVTEKDGLLYLHADRNVYIQNRQISHSGPNGTLVIDAGGDILLDAQTYEYTVGTTQTADNVRHITTESGSIVEAEGDITLQAEGDIKIKAGAVRSAQGSLRLLADQDIEITTGHTRMDSSYYWRHRNGGIGSKRGHFNQQETGQIKDPISTELLGNNILLAAKRDISLLSSNSIDRGNTRFKAGRDITSAVDTALQKTEYTKTFEGSGISFGKGLFGIRIGKWSEVHNSSETEETPVPTRITSVGGTVDLDAEGKVHATATYIYGKDGVTISGASVALDGAYAKRTYSQTDAYSFKGLQIGLGGTTVSYLNNAYVFGQNALRARDNRLKILEGVETKSEFDKAWSDYFDNTTSNNKITLSVALVSDKTKQTYDNVVVRSVGGSVASEGDIVIRAKDIQNGEIKLIGQTLSGKDIRLETYHLDMASGDNHSTTETGSHDSHAEIGADFGKAGYIAPKIGYAASQNETEETETYYTPTRINGDKISITAGGNMNIQGSTLLGEQVDIAVGGDLTITSDSASYTYRSKNAAIGMNVGLKSGQGGIDGSHANANKGKVDYRLNTVREQAGIFAGAGGINITVGGKTTLTGALIDSKADKTKNNITTNELELKNLTNKEILNSTGAGIDWSDGDGTAQNEQGLTPHIPIASNGSRTSTTYAAIVDGKLHITGDKDFNTDDVNRNTQDTLNALENTLDLQAIEEKKRLSELFAKHANEAVHKISDKNHWQDGSAEKVLLHAVVGGITAKIGGDNYAAGAWSGAVNEVINGEIAKYEATHGKIDPALHQWLSATVGVIVAHATGQTLQTGAAEAVYGTKWNLQYKDLTEESKLVRQALFEEIAALYANESGKDNTLSFEDLDLVEKGMYFAVKGIQSIPLGEGVFSAVYILKGQTNGFSENDIEATIHIPYEKNGVKKNLDFITFSNKSLIYQDLQKYAPKFLKENLSNIRLTKKQVTENLTQKSGGIFINDTKDHKYAINGAQVIVTSQIVERNGQQKYSFLITFMDLIDYNKNVDGMNKVGAALGVEPIAWKVSIPIEMTKEELESAGTLRP